MDAYGSAQEARTARSVQGLRNQVEVGNGSIAAESPISRELGAIVNGLAQVEQLVQTLRARLTPVLCLKPADPTTAKTPALSATGNGAVADSLYGSNQRISDIGREIACILADLAV